MQTAALNGLSANVNWQSYLPECVLSLTEGGQEHLLEALCGILGCYLAKESSRDLLLWARALGFDSVAALVTDQRFLAIVSCLRDTALPEWLLQLPGRFARCVVDAMGNQVRVMSSQMRDSLVQLSAHAGVGAYAVRGASVEGGWSVCFGATNKKNHVAANVSGSLEDNYNGRTWCVTMPSSFIFARRKLEHGVSAPVLMGNCFDSVTVVLFCAALSEYDQMLREDPTTNRMKESLVLFDEIVNSPWFRNTPIVLFLNKMDLFKEKIQRVPITVCFANYTGPNTEKESQVRSELCLFCCANLEFIFL